VGIDEPGKQDGAASVDDPRACGVVAHDAALDDNSCGLAKFTSIEHAHVGQRDLFAASRPGAVEGGGTGRPATWPATRFTLNSLVCNKIHLVRRRT
jgi:hypothetical protein